MGEANYRIPAWQGHDLWREIVAGAMTDPELDHRLLFLVLALVTAPIASLRAWLRGWGQRNLFRLDPEQLLAMDLDEVRRYVSG